MRWLSCASHVTVRIARFRARHFAELERRLADVDWSSWLAAGVPVAVHARAKRSKLIHTGALEQRLGLAISRSHSLRDEEAAGEAVTIQLRMFEDIATLSLDGGGRPLHERGWRLETAKAPLREDLAAALLLVGGIEELIGTASEASIVDPLCGSGTIAIEAAVRCRGLAPGRLRTFPIERLPRFADAALRSSGLHASPYGPAHAAVTIFASDRDEGAIAIAARNAERAQVADAIRFEVAPLSRARAWRDAAAKALVVSNPPYGVRIGNPAALGQLWQSLGA
ncbi:MAG: class I SAM-dependent RNA methyltransferase, partial [Planctomycetota bacterium]